MRILRYWLRLFLAFISRFKAIIFIGIFFGIILFLIFRFIYPLFFGRITQRVGLTGRYQTDQLPAAILSKISQGLTKLNDKGEVEPDLAEKWETGDGGKTWEFVLKEGNRWQDGTAVTADTIKYKFDGVTIERPDKNRIIFKLKEKFAPFPVVVSHPTFKKGLLGTGVWNVKKVNLAGSFLEELQLQNRNKDLIIIKFYPTEEQTKLAFKLGQVDTIIDLIDPKPFLNWKQTQVLTKSESRRFLAVFFNTQDNLLGDKLLRQALSYAINKTKLPGDRAISPLSPLSWGYNPQVKTYDFDPKRAKELEGEFNKKVKGEITLKLVTSPVLLDSAELIAKNWEAIGVKTQLQVTSVLPDEYQAFLAMYDIPSDPDQYMLWHSTQKATNITLYKNPRIDKLLEDGRTELDQEKRKEIYLDFQRYLLEDAPAAFLIHPISYTVTREPQLPVPFSL